MLAKESPGQSASSRRRLATRPASVEELTARNVALVVELEDAEKARRTAVDCAIDTITAFCGSMAFVWVHVLWFGGWILLNVLASKPLRFDPFPFQLLTLVVSLEAIFLSTFILITQNRQSLVADRRNHLDLQINMLSEQENTKMLLLLDRIARKVGVDVTDDAELTVMEEETQPERLVEQIQASTDPPRAEEPEAALGNP